MRKSLLLLWDVDGTLMSSGKAGVAAFNRAVEKLYGVKVSTEAIDFRGRTDFRNAYNMLKYLGMEESPERARELIEAYLEELPQELLQRSGAAYPGILEILEKADQSKHVLSGLLTGNFSRGAELKLSCCGLWNFFKFGAFGEDSTERNELGPIAVQRAKEIHGVEFESDEIFVIGDTPHDIECGKTIGARTIAVATGGYSFEELFRHQPTAVFENLGDTEKFWEVCNNSK